MSTNSLNILYGAIALVIAAALFRRAFDYAIPAGYLLLVAMASIVPSDFQGGAPIALFPVFLTLPWCLLLGPVMKAIFSLAHSDSLAMPYTVFALSAIVNAFIVQKVVRMMRASLQKLSR
jgi:hypothetical protein